MNLKFYLFSDLDICAQIIQKKTLDFRKYTLKYLKARASCPNVSDVPMDQKNIQYVSNIYVGWGTEKRLMKW